MHNVAQHAPRDRGVHIASVASVSSRRARMPGATAPSTPEVLMCTRRSASARYVTLNTAPLACDRLCTAGSRPIVHRLGLRPIQLPSDTDRRRTGTRCGHAPKLLGVLVDDALNLLDRVAGVVGDNLAEVHDVVRRARGDRDRHRHRRNEQDDHGEQREEAARGA